MTESDTPETDALEYSGYRWNMDCADVFRLARKLERKNRTNKVHGESIADLIPRWYEAGSHEQMLDEAYVQIRQLERRLAQSQARVVELEKELAKYGSDEPGGIFR